MRPLIWLWLRLALHVLLVGAALQSNGTSDAAAFHSRIKRSYSITKDILKEGFSKETQYDIGPWPVARDQRGRRKQIVHYCYGDAFDARLLVETVLRAIAYWYPTYAYSTLRIEPDPACRGRLLCLCAYDGIHPDTLAILDTRATHGKGRNGISHLTTSSNAIGHVFGHGKYFLNRIYFSHTPEYPPDPEKMTMEYIHSVAKAAYHMAHEFGHVIGLFDEHQRPDVRDWVSATCYNIPENQAEAARLEQFNNPEDFPAAMPGMERLRLVCSSEKLATRYGSHVDRFAPHTYEPSYKSPKYDPYSIMGYGTGNEDDCNNDLECKLTLHTWKLPTQGRAPLLNAGSENAFMKSISVGDLQAVAMLYPIDEETTALTLRLEQWRPEMVEFASRAEGIRLWKRVWPAPLPHEHRGRLDAWAYVAEFRWDQEPKWDWEDWVMRNPLRQITWVE